MLIENSVSEPFRWLSRTGYFFSRSRPISRVRTISLASFRKPQRHAGMIVIALDLNSPRTEKAAWKIAIGLTSLSQLLLTPHRLIAVALDQVREKR